MAVLIMAYAASSQQVEAQTLRLPPVPWSEPQAVQIVVPQTGGQTSATRGLTQASAQNPVTGMAELVSPDTVQIRAAGSSHPNGAVNGRNSGDSAVEEIPTPPAIESPVRTAVRPLMLAEASWTYRPPAQPRTIKLHDIVVVLVDEKTQVISEGEVDRRKTANASWSLKDWILFRGLALVPDPQSSGDPKISGQMEQRFRAEGDFESRGAMKFRIACEVVDIRPNATLVIEGRRWLRNNDELWEISLLGVIRPEDILPNNTVLSENVSNLRVYKREVGQVRDSFRRGWFTRWIDAYQPF